MDSKGRIYQVTKEHIRKAYTPQAGVVEADGDTMPADAVVVCLREAGHEEVHWIVPDGIHVDGVSYLWPDEVGDYTAAMDSMESQKFNMANIGYPPFSFRLETEYPAYGP